MKRLFLALLFGALAASPQTTEPVTLVLTFGLNAEADERWDGSVEVIAEGVEEQLGSMVDWCRVGPPEGLQAVSHGTSV